MAEKWDDDTVDSPEVVYEGFSPPGPTLCPTTTATNTTPQQNLVVVGQEDDGTINTPTIAAPTFIPSIVQSQGEGSQSQEETVVLDRGRLCFVCCGPVVDNFENVRTSMNHSHAPLIVLLTDVLGYKLEDNRLHSQVVCKACYHLLDIIDELQQTLAESKTDVRTKFLETIQRLRLKYPRTDKMLKPRCLRCVQMSQSSARRRGRGRGWRGREEATSPGRGGGGKGKAKGNKGRGTSPGGTTRAEDGQDHGNDDDMEGRANGGDLTKLTQPSKSHQHLATVHEEEDLAWQDRLAEELAQSLLQPVTLSGKFDQPVESLDSHRHNTQSLSHSVSLSGRFDRPMGSLNRHDNGTQSLPQSISLSGKFDLSVSPLNGTHSLSQSVSLCGKFDQSTGPLNSHHNGKVPEEYVNLISRNFTSRISHHEAENGNHIGDIDDQCILENGSDNLHFGTGEFNCDKDGKDNMDLTNHESELRKILAECTFDSPPKISSRQDSFVDDFCSDCSFLDCLDCQLCQENNCGVTYMYCDGCLTCQGMFVPWGCNSSLEFMGGKCSLISINLRTYVNKGKVYVFSQGANLSPNSCSKIQGEKTTKIIDKDIPRSTLGSHDIDRQSCTAQRALNFDKVLPRDTSDLSEVDKKLYCVQRLLNFETCVQEFVSPENTNEDRNNLTYAEEVDSENVSEYASCNRKESSDTCSSKRYMFSEKSYIDFGDISQSLSMERDGMDELLASPNLLGVKAEDVSDETAQSVFGRKGNLGLTNGDKMQSSDSRESISTPIPERDIFFTSPFTTHMAKCLDMDKDVRDAKVRLKFDVNEMMFEESSQAIPDSSVLFPISKEQNISNIAHAGMKDIPKKMKSIPKSIIHSKQRSTKNSSKERKLKTRGKRALRQLLADNPAEPVHGKRTRKLTEKAKNNIEDEIEPRPRKEKGQKKSSKTINEAGEEKIKKKLLSKEESGCKYVCEFCGKSFTSSWGFRYHVESHGAAAKMYSCEFCPYETRRQPDLKKHSFIHTREKHYRCEICGQEFSLNSSYKRHLRVHRSDMPHKCPTCSRGFRSAGTLKRHMLKHTGTKEFICEVCGVGFTLHHHYTVHRKLHSGELPYKCSLCQADFRNHHALRLHRRKTHPREESRRLHQARLNKKIVKGEIKVTKLTPTVPIQTPAEVLEQAVATAVELDTYECIDSSTQTQQAPSISLSSPDIVATAPLSLEINEKESVVLSITDMKRNGISDNIPTRNESTPMTIHESHNMQECPDQLQVSQASNVFQNTLCQPVNISENFLVMQGSDGALTSAKHEGESLQGEERRDPAGQMFIMLSNAHVQDPNLYFVMGSGGHTSN